MQLSLLGMAALLAFVAADSISTTRTVTSTSTTTTTTTVTAALSTSTSTLPSSSSVKAPVALALTTKSAAEQSNIDAITKSSNAAPPYSSILPAANKAVGAAEIGNVTAVIHGLATDITNATTYASTTLTGTSIASDCKVISATVSSGSAPTGWLEDTPVEFCQCHGAQYAGLTTSIANNGATLTVCDAGIATATAASSSTPKVTGDATASATYSSTSYSALATSSASATLAMGAAFHQLPSAFFALVVTMAVALYFG